MNPATAPPAQRQDVAVIRLPAGVVSLAITDHWCEVRQIFLTRSNRFMSDPFATKAGSPMSRSTG
jgi:hypothetical protein